MITLKMYYYSDSTYTYFDLDFLDVCNVMLVFCVYFRYLLTKGPYASKWWKAVKKRKELQKVNIFGSLLKDLVDDGHYGLTVTVVTAVLESELRFFCPRSRAVFQLLILSPSLGYDLGTITTRFGALSVENWSYKKDHKHLFLA